MICKICNKEFNGYLGLPGHLRHNHPNYNVKKYYDEFLKKEDEGYCKYCGKPTKFRTVAYGYNKYCNSRCANLDEEVQQKLKETFIKKYGVDNPNKSEEVIKKREKTCLEKYGTTSFMKTTEFRKSSIKSAHTSEINAKRTQTNLEKYGVNYPFQSNEIQQKVKQSCIEHYGENNPFRVDTIKDKIKQTNLEKYGAENPFASKDIQDKIKETNLMNLGVEYPAQNKEILTKMQQTCLEKYGVKNPWELPYIQSEECWIKRNNTLKSNKNQSSLEDYFEKLLIKNGYELNKTYKVQYVDNRYPYHCDFYLPNIDTFIEINGFWSHGGHWFNENNLDDIEKVKQWKIKSETKEIYSRAIIGWTIIDLNKKEKAKENNLNYIVLWNKDDIDNWFSQNCPIRKDWENDLKQYNTYKIIFENKFMIVDENYSIVISNGIKTIKANIVNIFKNKLFKTYYLLEKENNNIRKIEFNVKKDDNNENLPLNTIFMKVAIKKE